MAAVQRLVGVGIYISAIHLSYKDLVVPVFGYQRYIYVTPNPAVYGTSVVVLLALALILPARICRPGDLILWITYLLVIVPSLTIAYLAGAVPARTDIHMTAVIALCFAGIVGFGRIPTTGGWAARIPKPSAAVFWFAIFVFSMATYASLAGTGRLSLDLPSITNVYGTRDAFKDATDSSGGPLGYLLSTQSYVVNPLIVIAGVYKKRSALIVIGLAGEILLFAAAGLKSTLFAVPAILIVSIVFRKDRRPSGQLALWGMSAVIAVSALADKLTHSITWTSLFTRRFIDTPGLLTGAWVNVWQHLPKAHYAYGFLSPYFQYPYNQSPPYIVGTSYFGRSSLDANANLFADGYANFGWVGMALEALVLAVVIVLINALSHGLPLRVTAVLFVMPTIALSNSSVFTSLLTHGVFLSMLVVAFARREDWAVLPATPSVAAPPSSAGRPRRMVEHGLP